MIGFIDEIKDLEAVGQNNRKVLRFFFNNNSGTRVQVVAWNEEAVRISALIKTNLVNNYYKLIKKFLLNSAKKFSITFKQTL